MKPNNSQIELRGCLLNGPTRSACALLDLLKIPYQGEFVQFNQPSEAAEAPASQTASPSRKPASTTSKSPGVPIKKGEEPQDHHDNLALAAPVIHELTGSKQTIYGDASTILKYICVRAGALAKDRKDPEAPDLAKMAAQLSLASSPEGNQFLEFIEHMASTNVSRITKLTLQKALVAKNEEIDEEDYGADPEQVAAVISEQLESEKQIFFDVILSQVENQLEQSNSSVRLSQTRQHLNDQLVEEHRRYAEMRFFDIVEALAQGEDELILKDSQQSLEMEEAFLFGPRLSAADIYLYNEVQSAFGVVKVEPLIDGLRVKYPFVYAWYRSLKNIPQVQKYVAKFHEEQNEWLGLC